MTGQRHHPLLGEPSIAKLSQTAMPAGRQRQVVGQPRRARRLANAIARGPKQEGARRTDPVLVKALRLHQYNWHAQSLQAVEVLDEFRKERPPS